MPEMTLLGWFHTVMGIGAVLIGFYTVITCRVFSLTQRTGRIYAGLTLIVAASALGIYNQGGFGIAHILALLTLAALGFAVVMEKTRLFGAASKYFQALGYTSTLLFHMIPAITDFLRRLPIGDPFIDSFDDPLLRQFHLAFLLAFVVGFLAQVVWLGKQGAEPVPA